MIVNKYGNGSGGGVTPEQVQQEIQSALTPYWESGETKDYVDGAVSGIDLSNYYTSAQTEEAISAATSGKADAANIAANTGNFIFPKWNSQGIISGVSQQVFQSYLDVNDGGDGAYFFMNTSKYDAQNKALKLYTPLSAGTAGDILVSAGHGAPVWSAVTMGGVSQEYVDSAITKVQDQLDLIDEVIPAAIVDINNRMVSSNSVSTLWRGTQAQYDAIITKDPNTLYIIVNE